MYIACIYCYTKITNYKYYNKLSHKTNYNITYNSFKCINTSLILSPAMILSMCSIAMSTIFSLLPLT